MKMTWSKNGIALVAPLALAMPLLFGMRACGDDVPLGMDDCATEGACGAAALAPIYTCWDGSSGGNTGQCIPGDDGVCHWEYRDCPPPPDDCTAMECGDPPATPLATRCERSTMDGCQWVIDDPSDCAMSDCGPPPPDGQTWTCEDGTVGGFTGQCRAQDGACEWEFVECAMAGECAIDECGPALGAPACVCGDGSIGCNTGRCLRDARGTCGWEWRECPAETIRCGGLMPEPVDCGAGFFCAFPLETMCGAADHPGSCQRRPSADECVMHSGTPVCGCDGLSYDSECAAWAAGTSAYSSGPCVPPAI